MYSCRHFKNSVINEFFVLVPGGSFVSEEVISESYIIGEYVENYLSEDIQNTSKEIIIRSDLTGFNRSKVLVILVEMGFMSDPKDDE